MRRARQGGTCSECGRQATDGLYWENAPVVLDLGNAANPEYIEPDMTAPVRCDECEEKQREAEYERAKKAFGWGG